jgi:hypothetical protein
MSRWKGPEKGGARWKAMRSARLEAIIEKRTVRYQVWPHYEMHDGRQVMVGFDLELLGTHDGNTRLFPGCDSAPRALQVCGR